MSFKFDYQAPQVIAEIGCNHMGQIDIAKELIDLAKEAGVSYVKFQKRNNKELLTEEQYNEGCLQNLRIVRNQILNSTDKYATLDFPHSTEEKKQEWFTYRQALRDLTTTVVEQNVVLDPDLTNVTWPTPPS